VTCHGFMNHVANINILMFSWASLVHIKGQLIEINIQCHNLSLGLMTKARAYEGAGQECSLGVTFHVLGSVGDCEGMNLHIPK
jgi:hypothetical protein